MTSILTLQPDQTGLVLYAKPTPETGYVTTPSWAADTIDGVEGVAGQYVFPTDDAVDYVILEKIGVSKASTDRVLAKIAAETPAPLSGTATSTVIGQFAPAATISSAFTSTGDLDLTDDTYTVTVFRNGATSGATATIGTITATVLPYSYTLPGSYVAGDTGRIVLTNSAGDVVAVHRFGVTGSGLTPEQLAKIDSIQAGKVEVVSPVSVDGEVLSPILVGDDYDASDREFVWSLEPRGYDITAGTMVFAGTNGHTGWRATRPMTLVSGRWVGRFSMRRSTEFAEITAPSSYDYSVAVIGPDGYGEETIARGTVKTAKQYTRNS